MDEFEDLLNKSVLSDTSILERVDEYTLYCRYLGFEPMLRTKYQSIIRTRDTDPSFSMFESKKPDREYFWKDNGIGDAGDIFKLIRLKFGLNTTQDVYKKIDCDFKLGYTDGVPPPESKIILHDLPKKSSETHIRIQSKLFTEKDLKFWGSFGISIRTLSRYKVRSLKYYWLRDTQDIPKAPKNLAFSYEVLGKYKLYQPYMPLFKFRNDYTERCLEGFAQLAYLSDILVITKSMKDVMVLAEYGYEAVAARSENTVIPDEYMRHFYKKYKKILILFDNDMKHKGDAYQADKIYVPITSGEKDISDFRRRYGHELTKNLLKTIIK